MGLFDTILIKTKCPKCGFEDEDLQTKALDPGLRTFKPGDALPKDFSLFGIKEGWIEGHTYCKSCNTGNSYKVIVKDNRITDQVELLEQSRLLS
jgi:hypothetical protein